MSEASEKKTRSPTERLIVWGLIAVLLVVVFIEYRASTNFNAAQSYLTEAVERKPTPTVDEVNSRVSGASIGSIQKDELGTEEYELAFFSLFKSDTYKLRVQLMDIPADGPELSMGERQIAEVYVPAVADAVRKEHADFIVNTPHAPPLPDNGAGGGADDGGDGGDGGESNPESSADPDSTSVEGEETESPSGPDDTQSPPAEE